MSPITWKGGWPYFGLPGNLRRTPRTWVGVSYNTAWLLKHKLMQAMVERGSEQVLGGIVMMTASQGPGLTFTLVTERVESSEESSGVAVCAERAQN